MWPSSRSLARSRGHSNRGVAQEPWEQIGDVGRRSSKQSAQGGRTMKLTRRHLTLIAIIGVLIALVGVAGLTLDRGGGGGDEADGDAARSSLDYTIASDTQPR